MHRNSPVMIYYGEKLIAIYELQLLSCDVSVLESDAHRDRNFKLRTNAHSKKKPKKTASLTFAQRMVIRGCAEAVEVHILICLGLGSLQLGFDSGAECKNLAMTWSQF